MGQGVVERFGPYWRADTSNEPELLVEFYFDRAHSIGRFDVGDTSELLTYINEVLNKRKADLSRARSLLRAAHCLNDLDAVVHWKSLCDAIEGVIKVYGQMHADVLAAQSSIGGVPAYFG